MKKIIVLLLLSLIILSGCGAEKEDDVLRVGVIVLVEHPALDATVEGAKQYLEEQGLKDKIVFDVKYAQGDLITATTIANQYVQDGVDLIYAIATNSAQAAYTATRNTDIPVIFNAVTDPVDAVKIVKSLEEPGENVSGVSDIAPIANQVALIKEIMPNIKKVGMLQALNEPNATVQIEQAKEEAKKLGIEVVVKGVSTESEVAIATDQLVEQVEAIYNITDNLVVSSTATILNKANLAGIPVFAAEDGQFDLGLLAAESISYLELGKLAGEMIKEVLIDGKDISKMSVRSITQSELKVNLEVAEKLGITIPESVLSRLGK